MSGEHAVSQTPLTNRETYAMQSQKIDAAGIQFMSKQGRSSIILSLAGEIRTCESRWVDHKRVCVEKPEIVWVFMTSRNLGLSI